jgi:hypothetical protein
MHVIDILKIHKLGKSFFKNYDKKLIGICCNRILFVDLHILVYEEKNIVKNLLLNLKALFSLYRQYLNAS